MKTKDRMEERRKEGRHKRGKKVGRAEGREGGEETPSKENLKKPTAERGWQRKVSL